MNIRAAPAAHGTFFRDQTVVLGLLPLAKIILSSDTCELKEIQHATKWPRLSRPCFFQKAVRQRTESLDRILRTGEYPVSRPLQQRHA